MIRKILGAAAASVLLLTSACTTITLAKAGPYAVSPGYQVQLGRDWSDMSKVIYPPAKSLRLLSIDGPLLNRLYISEGLAPGGYMVKPVAKDKPTPLYKSRMAPTELIEFVADSVSVLGYLRTETSNIRPTKMNGQDAIRFDLASYTTEGLSIRGTAMVSEQDGKLYVILYLAPQEHYFDATLAEVEHIMTSASRAG